MSLSIIRGFGVFLVVVIAGAGLCLELSSAAIGKSQNANSSMTMPQNANSATANENANMGTPRRGRRGRRRPATPPETTGDATMNANMHANMNMSGDTMPMAASEQADLSGTYTGVFDCADAGVSGETTLTITGNQFTLSDGKTGRITAVTTRGYTGAAMQFGESTVGSTPVIVSMRARKSGDRLTLMPVSDSGHVCSFMPAGSRRRSRRARAPMPPAQEAMPSEAPAATPTSTPTPTPAP